MADGTKSIDDMANASKDAAATAAGAAKDAAASAAAATRNTVDKAESQARSMADSARDVAHDLQDRAADVAAKAGEKAKSAASSAKDYAADGVHTLADAARDVAGKFGDDGQGAKVAEYTRKAADGLDRFSDTLKAKDLDELASDARSAVRNHPAIAVGAAAVIGFALARFLKGGGDRRA